MAGKKAARLHELLRAFAADGIAIPRGFVLTDRDALAAPGFRERLGTAIDRIGGFPIAARSSSRYEDLEGASFAGQYESHLEIETLDDAIAKIEACFRSAETERVRAYAASKGGEIARQASRGGLSVLVQKMVPAEMAGVLFTVHPTEGREDRMLVETTKGLGERLVSGQISPSRYSYAWESETISDESVTSDGGSLHIDDLRTLGAWALRIEAHYGRPQDIEWAKDGAGKIHILQSRPITRIFWRKDVDEFTNADFKDGGVSARVCTPMMYSLYREAMQRSMQRYFQDIRLLERDAPQKSWIETFYGRPYWNASEVKRRLFRVPGFDEKAFDEDLGIQKDYGAAGPRRVPTNLRTILPVIPTALALEKCYARQLASTEHYGRTFLPEYEHLLLKLRSAERGGESTELRSAERASGTLDDTLRLADRILLFQARTEFDYFTTIYNNSNYQSDFKKLLEGVAKRTGEKPSLVKLVSGLADISHLKIQQGLLKLVAAWTASGPQSPAYAAERAEYLRENGFHADEELNLLCPRWDEVPDLVDARVARLAESAASLRDPRDTVEAQVRESENERQAIEARLARSLVARMGALGKFRKMLARARLYLQRREQMREYSTRAYALVRLALLELDGKLRAAGALREKDDVFFLLREEILERAWEKASPIEWRRRIELRKLRFRGLRDLAPPNELGGKVVQRAADGEAGADGKTLRGLGCSPGRIQARVRVVANLDEAYLIHPEEILVTQFTDPGWTPVFGKIAGVVTEVGGMLSHAAVIGREYGIPAILNLPGARARLRTGQLVEMDGESGEIRVLD